MGKGCCSSSKSGYDHFEGKSAYEHLKAARLKVANRMGESHGLNIKGPMICALDAAKETSLIFALLTLVLQAIGYQSLTVYCFVLLGWLIWKAARGAFLGWARLNKLNRVIEEEQYEITHNRAQEKEELEELYRLKGFEGELLDQVIDVLMADDNRLLGVMLDEELGLRQEQYEHPLKLAFGNFCGVLCASLVLLTSLFIPYAFWVSPFLIVGIAAFFHARIERIAKMSMVVWNMACLFLAAASSYFLKELMG